ncbi:uncharacterized protein LOC110273621 [Arachis duranensis]|uniref:Uncharacterized protein LOC110273621 n=1 Tax=Arachis duranensis TaxID=130453 RepID=A0A6P5MHL4_ARADU|nr:uncharacterized protein LOC110273621 [Arachis duranensis]
MPPRLSSSPCPKPKSSVLSLLRAARCHVTVVLSLSCSPSCYNVVEEVIADNNASVNNNLSVDSPISNDAANSNPPSSNDNMLDGVVGIGSGYRGSSYDKLRVLLLVDLKRECQMLVDSYRSAWKETECTSWLMVTEWIDPNDIVYVVTDNAANYIMVGRLINKKYENIYWSPRAAHCLNLILKDVNSMAHISIVESRASKITIFVAASAIILDSKFWNDYFTACKIVDPLIKLLRIVDADDKPPLRYVYEGMLRAEDAIKEMFKQNKTAYQLYTDIINSRWDKHLKKDLYAADYFLNLVTEEVVEKEPDLSSNVDDLLRDIDADLYQSDGGSSGIYTAPLDSSAQEDGNDSEDDHTKGNLQQVFADFDY